MGAKPMGLSSLINRTGTIVSDTSVVINLNATGLGLEILHALPNPVVITDVVLDELRDAPRNGRNDAELVGHLIRNGRVAVVGIDTLSGNDFERLVSGSSAATLDDGEAATIAYASENGMAAIIDERKANQICQARYPALLLGSTMDILAHPNIEAALGRTVLAEAVHNALTNARMRVLPKYMSWTIALIGAERAKSCESLPRHVRVAATD
jgi:predicted nucleic acid-binding protein